MPHDGGTDAARASGYEDDWLLVHHDSPCSMRRELAVNRRPRHVAGAFFLRTGFFAGVRRAAVFFVAFFVADFTTLVVAALRATDFLAVARLRGAAALVPVRRCALGESPTGSAPTEPSREADPLE
jgi:hypothetical protein